ncbi:hypothetical protein N0V90_002151 [Kalmusia sp. IMI 367209]|nr:hypothetical protein N0V90_002151 [Kalmusia sp. IMI 367209]
MIYEYALTAPRPLVIDMDTGNPSRPVLFLPPNEKKSELADQANSNLGEQHHSYNQLKFVNKQVRSESEGLELKLNRVRIIETEDFPEVMGRFTSFLTMIKPDRRAWISKLIIDSDCCELQEDEAKDPRTAIIKRFADDYPHVTVCWIFCRMYLTFPGAPAGTSPPLRPCLRVIQYSTRVNDRRKIARDLETGVL